MTQFSEHQAIYLQIADRLCEQLLIGRWKNGERIPSVREVAAMMEVNPNTVMRTFSFLQDMGIIQNKRGVGFFISPDGTHRATAWKKEQFLQEELPQFFKSLELLGLTLEDVKQYMKTTTHDE